MFTPFLRSALALTIASTATLAVIAGSAAPVAAAETVTVSVAAYNLATSAGRAAAETAIERAVQQVCDTGTPEQAAAAKASRACYTAAMAAALPQLDAIAQRGTNTQVASITIASPGL
jgi:UrcA family protein